MAALAQKVSDEPLDQDNEGEVFDAVLKVAARFNHFGRALGLNASDITEIQQTFSHNRQDGLEQVINLWLQQNYNLDKYGVPSWRRLVVAVESQSGGKNRALAKKIAAEHPEVPKLPLPIECTDD